MTPPPRLSLILLLFLLGQAPAGAQFPPLTVPRGLFRVELGGSFLTADRRFRAGESENLATDFVRAAAGSNLFPLLEPADALIQNLTQIPDSRINLGSTSASHHVTTGTGVIGLGYGLTRGITLFASLPIVRVKVRSTLELDELNGRAGFNPADPLFGTAEGQAQAAQFFGQFDAALISLQQKLTAGDYDSDPALRALAEATLASATSVRSDLHALVLGAGTASPFLPIRTSAAGAAIRLRVAGLQTILSGSLGVGEFTDEPTLPDATLSNDEFQRFLTDAAGPIAGMTRTPSLSALGDMEVGLAVTLVDRLAGGTSGVRIAAQGLARLPTSFLSDPARFFEVGTGDKQTDVEGTLVADAVLGRLGFRASAGYSLQLAGTAERRITPPDQPLPAASTLARISRNPGDLLSVGVTPMFRIADNFALTGGAVWRRKGADEVILASDQDPIAGVEPGLLALETDGSWTTATLGLSYSVPLMTRDGRTRMPLDAGLAWDGVVASSGPLRVTRTTGIRFWLRLYGGF